ncbi:hypothetical protein BDD12DRAFT_351138 [Trichophaea hybrida]|nr:hypothetical protein BDD12DRAFT_351138 [Trichophaea hybrida]
MSITIPTEDNSQLRCGSPHPSANPLADPPRCNTSRSPETPPPRKPSSARIPARLLSLLKVTSFPKSVTITTFLSLKPFSPIAATTTTPHPAHSASAAWQDQYTHQSSSLSPKCLATCSTIDGF